MSNLIYVESSIAARLRVARSKFDSILIREMPRSITVVETWIAESCAGDVYWEVSIDNFSRQSSSYRGVEAWGYVQPDKIWNYYAFYGNELMLHFQDPSDVASFMLRWS